MTRSICRIVVTALFLLLAGSLSAQSGYQPRTVDGTGGSSPQAAPRDLPAKNPSGLTTMWVRRDAADVFDSAKRDANRIAELKKSQPVAVIAKEGLRYQIQLADGRTGYIAKLYLTDIKPVGGDEGFKLFASDDIGAGEQANVESVRGLRKGSEDAAVAEGMEEIVMEQLSSVENLAISISEDQVSQFLEEGGVFPI